MFASYPIQIRLGAADWQVFQRADDRAQIRVCGVRRIADAPGEAYVRVTEENTGKPVLPWSAVTTDGEKWTAELSLPTGGPYRLETCVKERGAAFDDAFAGDARRHLYVGDVFLIAGQSNAVGYARDAYRDPPCAGVSVFRQNGRWALATHPLHDGTDSIYKNLDVPAPAHSPWLAFARTVFQKTKIPIGLIPSALGGSPLEAWVPGALLYENALEMIRAAGGKVRGVLWYQGCADALAYETEGYEARFIETMQAFRAALKIPCLPFFTCQLNGFNAPGTAEDDAAWTAIRNAQAQAANPADVYFLPTAGMRLYDQIHNCASSNVVIGRLTAYQVLRALYGIEDPRAEPLQISAVQRRGKEITLVFRPETARLSVGARIRQSLTAWDGTEQLSIDTVKVQENTLTVCGPDLPRADRLQFAQCRNMHRAGITDRTCGRVAAPFIKQTEPLT